MTVAARFFVFFVCFFLQVGNAVSGAAVDTKHKVSLIPGGLETPCLLHFTYPCKEMLDKMKGLVVSNLRSKTKGSWFTSCC